HGNAIGGVLIGKDVEAMDNRVFNTYKLMGGNANPFDAFLLIQGIKTLAVRMDRHCSNAVQVAAYLEKHPAIKTVNYNGLVSHPGYNISQNRCGIRALC